MRADQLHPLEVRALRAADGGVLSADTLISKYDFNLGQCNQTFSWLLDKRLVEERSRQTSVEYRLTELGSKAQQTGTHEEQIVRLVLQGGASSLPEIGVALGLEQRDVGSAFGALAKEGVLHMDGQRQVTVLDAAASARLASVRQLLDRAAAEQALDAAGLSAAERAVVEALSRKRGASRGVFRAYEQDRVLYALTAAGAELQQQLARERVTGIEVGALTPELLAGGRWREAHFRPYNVSSPAGRVLIGRRNPYAGLMDELKDKLTSLGFEEFDGPLVETNFWCCDALFMPQFHAARDEHDVYFIREPHHASTIEQPYFDQVAATHEDGWQTGSRGWAYDFDRDFAKRTILRSQGTALSAKQLPTAKVPGKYFGLVRCFRPDDIDATHLSEFYQTEGIVLGEEVSLKTLLGLLRMFAEEVAGATEVRYEPAYFPFTEPSVEVYIKHPVLGWMELGGAGILRPEVTRPLGVDVPVLAWGLGIDRMALMALGLDDLRDLFAHDLDRVRLRRQPLDGSAA
jgi:phenylalanyl-tRNA synthetase alpha chain